MPPSTTLEELHTPPRGMVREAEAEQALFNEALKNPSLEGRVMHNNFMYQDPAEGPSILNVNASIPVSYTHLTLPTTTPV